MKRISGLAIVGSNLNNVGWSAGRDPVQDVPGIGEVGFIAHAVAGDGFANQRKLFEEIKHDCVDGLMVAIHFFLALFMGANHASSVKLEPFSK